MKRRGMALGLAALMTCTALFTTTANAKKKGSDEKETIKKIHLLGKWRRKKGY